MKLTLKDNWGDILDVEIRAHNDSLLCFSIKGDGGILRSKSVCIGLEQAEYLAKILAYFLKNHPDVKLSTADVTKVLR